MSKVFGNTPGQRSLREDAMAALALVPFVFWQGAYWEAGKDIRPTIEGVRDVAGYFMFVPNVIDSRKNRVDLFIGFPVRWVEGDRLEFRMPRFRRVGFG